MKKKLYRSEKAIVLALQQAEMHRDTLAKQLQEATQLLNSERSQVVDLQGYKQEYINEISLQKDCSITLISRYRTFCHQLEELIVQQQHKVSAIEEKIKELNQLVYSQQYKISVLQKRHDENQKQIALLEEKTQQKLIDELTTIRFSRSSQ